MLYEVITAGLAAAVAGGVGHGLLDNAVEGGFHRQRQALRQVAVQVNGQAGVAAGKFGTVISSSPSQVK